MTSSIKIFRLSSPAKSFLRKNVALSLVLTLVASLLVAVFFLPNSANAVDVTDCTSMGQLRNGGFESPVAGTTIINASNSTYPADTDTNAQQNSNNSNATGVYGPISGGYWNHLDASVDTSTTRSFALSGAANDARVYWYTTEATEQLELASFTTTHAGARFAELNATVRAALYQDIVTVPGVTIRWSLAHKGRGNTNETMNVSIGKPTNSIATVRASTSRFNTGADSGNSTLSTNSNTRTTSAKAGLTIQSAYAAGSSTPTTSITDNNSAWRVWYGTYTETSTTTSLTRFLFESTDAGGSGNLLDSVTFSPVAACPISRTLDSPTNSATIDVFDTAQGSFALVPTETGHSESITALTRLEGNGVATLNSGNRTFSFSPNGAGTTRYSYTINYSANGISSSSTGTISIVARDVFGNASCDPGSLETTTSTSAGVTTALITFKTPTQANTDNDSDHLSATCTWTVPEGVNAVDYLVVGGGGGGASGGGGGGGVVTSWRTVLANATGTTRTEARNPLGVTPGEVINVTVGGGGKRGWGGTTRWQGAAGTTPTRTATKGSDSVFGSITAVGGGFGGSARGAGGSGGSGGGASYDSGQPAGAAAASEVIGASSFGNAGGVSNSTGFSAGGGGGGAGTAATTSSPPSGGNGGIGGNIRNVTSSFNNGGGHGGRGVATDIASLTAGTFREYGCGGGGGVNYNDNVAVTNGNGIRGCSSAANGSSYGNLYTNTTTAFFNGDPLPTESFGGGGGGTDPEDAFAGSGGSGVVIIRYILTDTRCPNSSNNTAITGPIACPYPITITAGASVAVNYNLTYGDATNGYVSFPGNSTDTATVTSSIANGTDTVTVSYSNSNRLASFAVSNANTRLAGATYPMRYTINSGSNSSTSYILLRITDPSQATPVIVPVDPRATFVDLSGVRIGGSQMTQVCFTPQADNSNAGYGNLPKVETSTARSTETATITASLGRLRLQGTSTNLQNAMDFVRVTKHPSDTYLLPGSASRKISVNVSNGTVGGNGSCTFGNESTIELKPIGIDQTIRRNVIQLRKRE